MAMRWNRRMLPGAALAAVLWCASGCGSNSQEVVLAPVTGRVTLEGRPVANAWVRFQPSRGRGSQGRTNDNGVYLLEYTTGRRGAILGQHRVEIGTRETQDSFGNPVERPELIPARYNSASTLQANISSGENVVDLELNLAPGDALTPVSSVARTVQ